MMGMIFRNADRSITLIPSCGRSVKRKHYQGVLEGYGGDILLVGVNYDPGTKEHTCIIFTIRARTSR